MLRMGEIHQVMTEVMIGHYVVVASSLLLEKKQQPPMMTTTRPPRCSIGGVVSWPWQAVVMAYGSSMAMAMV